MFKTLPSTLPRGSYIKGDKYYEECHDHMNKSLNYLFKSNIITLYPSDNTVWAIDNLAQYNNILGSVDEIFPLIDISFEGNMYLAPKNYINFLQRKYGDIYQLPIDMTSHRHVKLTNSQVLELNEILKR